MNVIPGPGIVQQTDAGALAQVLETMRGHGLIARATHITVGSVSIVMLAAPQEAAESEAARERRSEDEIRDVLFGSA